MDNVEGDSAQTNVLSISQSITKVPQLVCKEDVTQMINLQMSAIDRLEATNKGLHSCNILAMDKYATTMKLFKKTAKQMNESKKDLDIIYKKIIELKHKIRAEKPHLFENKSSHEKANKNDNKQQEPQAEIEQQQQQHPRDQQMDPTNTRPIQRSAEIAIIKTEK